MDPKPFTGSVWSREEWTVHLFSGRTPTSVASRGIRFGSETIHRFGVVKRGMDCPPPLGSYSISVVSRGIRFGSETIHRFGLSREEWTVHLFSGRTPTSVASRGIRFGSETIHRFGVVKRGMDCHLLSGRTLSQWSVEGYALIRNHSPVRFGQERNGLSTSSRVVLYLSGQ